MTNVFLLQKHVLFDQKNKTFFFKMLRAIILNIQTYIHKKRKHMPTSNPLSLILSSTFNKESKYFFNPFTYQFNLNDLQPAIGEAFSYFTQASWTNFSSKRTNLTLKSSDIPVPCSSTEIIPNERTITIE